MESFPVLTLPVYWISSPLFQIGLHKGFKYFEEAHAAGFTEESEDLLCC
jgi:hypothetical protein